MQGVLVDKLPQNVKEGKIIPICCTEESKKDASLKDAHSTFYYDDENNYYQPFGAGIYAKSTLPKLIEHYRHNGQSVAVGDSTDFPGQLVIMVSV